MSNKIIILTSTASRAHSSNEPASLGFVLDKRASASSEMSLGSSPNVWAFVCLIWALVYYIHGQKKKTYRFFEVGARLRTPVLYDPNKLRPLGRVGEAVLWQPEIVCHEYALPTQTKLYQCAINKWMILLLTSTSATTPSPLYSESVGERKTAFTTAFMLSWYNAMSVVQY